MADAIYFIFFILLYLPRPCIRNEFTWIAKIWGGLFFCSEMRISKRGVGRRVARFRGGLSFGAIWPTFTWTASFSFFLPYTTMQSFNDRFNGRALTWVLLCTPSDFFLANSIKNVPNSHKKWSVIFLLVQTIGFLLRRLWWGYFSEKLDLALSIVCEGQEL